MENKKTACKIDVLEGFEGRKLDIHKILFPVSFAWRQGY